MPTPPSVEKQNAGRPPSADAQDVGQVPAQKESGRPGDRVEISDEAKELLDGSPITPSSREAAVEAARARLESGELFTPESYENAAAKLLQSGDLEGTEGE